MEKSRKINGWKAKNFKIKTEAGKHSRSNLLTTYDKVLRLQCILCSEGMYPASWELTIHRRMKKSRLCIVKKLFFGGRVVSRAISDLCLRIFSVMDHSVHSLKASAQKSELHPRSFRAFSGSVAQLRWRLLKACRQSGDLFYAFLDRICRTEDSPPAARVAGAAQESGAMHPANEA